MQYQTLLLAAPEPCWLWWLILSALAFILGAIVGCLLCGNKKRLRELEEENAGLKARNNNWEKDFAGLKYQQGQSEASLKDLRAKLNSCEADKRILESKLEKARNSAGEVERSSMGSAPDTETPSKAEKLAMNVLGFSSNPGDLKIIEGIGPKIESLLKADGISTWQELEHASVDRLKGILEKAGNRFGLAQPDTWPQQAALAAAGQWEALRKLQDELQGGIDKG